MREIYTFHEDRVLVDDEDYEWLLGFKWNTSLSQASKRGLKYAACRQGFMHRMILEAPKGTHVDHINHEGLDNRRGNLRLANHSLNAANQRHQEHRPYKGVYARKCGTFFAQSEHMEKRYYLGTFQTEEEAAQAYDVFALQTWGEYANLNFPAEQKDLAPLSSWATGHEV